MTTTTMKPMKPSEICDAAFEYLDGIKNGELMFSLLDLVAISSERAQEKFWAIVHAEVYKIVGAAS